VTLLDWVLTVMLVVDLVALLWLILWEVRKT
jgi:hypothetical protein